MEIGDVVTWTHGYQRGRTVNLSTRKGKILDIYGDTAIIKFRGERIALTLDRLTPWYERTHLTKMIIGDSK